MDYTIRKIKFSYQIFGQPVAKRLPTKLRSGLAHHIYLNKQEVDWSRLAYGMVRCLARVKTPMKILVP